MKRYTIGLITLLLIVGCGKKDGLHTTYFDDAKKHKMSETTYKDGNTMDYGLNGTEMDRRKKKELTRMGK